MDDHYLKREIDHIFGDIKNSLTRIEVQTTKHNGRLTKLERYLLIVGCVSATILFMNGSELLNFVKLLFL